MCLCPQAVAWQVAQGMHLINVGLIELNCKVVHLAGAWVGGRVAERAHAAGAIRMREYLQNVFRKR